MKMVILITYSPYSNKFENPLRRRKGFFFYVGNRLLFFEKLNISHSVDIAVRGLYNRWHRSIEKQTQDIIHVS